MNEKQLTFEGVMRIVQGNKWIQLKDIERLEKFIQNQQATIQSLKEENEQLKKEYKIAIDEMVTDYKKLEKENEQLKKDVKELEEEKRMTALQVTKKLNDQQDIINELQSIINHCERKTESGKKRNEEKSEEPVYYNSNGLSPNRAFEQGLISKEEFIGFIKGNIIKYVVRCGKKGNPIEDIDKAIDYLHLLKKIMRFDDDSKMVIDDE